MSFIFARVGKNMIPLYARIESLLRSKILSGQYGPGEKLRTKEELAMQFGVSKITVTNALAHLRGEGLITSDPRQGNLCGGRNSG